MVLVGGASGRWSGHEYVALKNGISARETEGVWRAPFHHVSTWQEDAGCEPGRQPLPKHDQAGTLYRHPGLPSLQNVSSKL